MRTNYVCNNNNNDDDNNDNNNSYNLLITGTIDIVYYDSSSNEFRGFLSEIKTARSNKLYQNKGLLLNGARSVLSLSRICFPLPGSRWDQQTKERWRRE